MIAGLNVLYPSLSANINIPFSIDEPLGHDLIDTYLADQVSLNQISIMIDGYAAYLAFLIGYLPDTREYYSYYKLSVEYAKYLSGALLGPNSVLCMNGVCDDDFDYYVPDPMHIGLYRLYLLPSNNFVSGVYSAARTGMLTEPHLFIKLASDTTIYHAEVISPAYGSIYYSCHWTIPQFKPEMNVGSVSFVYNWNLLLASCPGLVENNTFISE